MMYLICDLTIDFSFFIKCMPDFKISTLVTFLFMVLKDKLKDKNGEFKSSVGSLKVFSRFFFFEDVKKVERFNLSVDKRIGFHVSRLIE